MMDTHAIIQTRYDVHKNMKMDSVDNDVLNELSTPFCQLLWLSVGLNPESSQYGDMLGGFLYKPDGRIFTFRYHIHEPNQKYANLSNKMTTISEIVEQTYHLSNKSITMNEEIPTAFGHRAFWVNTPMSALESDDEKHLRHLMTCITKYSREQDFCRRLRKTDKKRIAYVTAYEERMKIHVK